MWNAHTTSWFCSSFNMKPGLQSTCKALNFTVCIALRCVVGSYCRFVHLSKTLYHTCFKMVNVECKWWSRRPKLFQSVISDAKAKAVFYCVHSNANQLKCALCNCFFYIVWHCNKYLMDEIFFQLSLRSFQCVANA